MLVQRFEVDREHSKLRKRPTGLSVHALDKKSDASAQGKRSKGNRAGRCPSLSLGVSLLMVLFALLAIVQVRLVGSIGGISLEADRAAAEQPIALSGWFTVIWNHRTHYFLTDDQGQWTELLLDEEMVKPFGGPLAFNRKRVKIAGERVAAPPGAVRVLSIAFE